jgi:MFS family permease
VVSLVQFTTTHIWQTVVLAFIGAPFFTAFVISLAPMLLQLLPRSGGMGELLGKLVAPFSLFAVAFSFLAAWVVDLTGNYRVIWLFPAVAGVVQAVMMFWLWVPEGHERAELGGLFERMSESIMNQVTGRDRPLLGGVVTAEDADSASLFDMARNILGNPYEDSVTPEPGTEEPAPSDLAVAVPDGPPPGVDGPLAPETGTQVPDPG